MTGPATALPATQRLKLRIPIRPDLDAVLYVPWPMTDDDWHQFIAVIDAMKPGLVRIEESPKDGGQ